MFKSKNKPKWASPFFNTNLKLVSWVIEDQVYYEVVNLAVVNHTHGWTYEAS